MLKRITTLLLTAFLFSFAPGYGQIATTYNNNAVNLAATLAGPGVVITNPTVRGSGLAIGTFDATGQGLGIDRGIIFSTGDISEAFPDADQPSPLPFNNYASTDLGTAGHPMITTIGGANSEDAIVFEMDFVPTSDTVVFEFIFASEEYREYVNSNFNDAFAFLISGPGIPGGVQNLAVLPGTTTPVSINTINNGDDNTYPGPCTNCAYYVDNEPENIMEYDGYTTPLQAVSAVTPCEVYHLELVIADVSDGAYDSAILLEENSLSSIGTRIDPPVISNGAPYLFEGCNTGEFTFHLTDTSSVDYTLYYYISGQAINGQDYAQVADSTIILAGDTTFTLTISPSIDSIIEPDEDITICIDAKCAALGIACETVTLRDFTISTIPDTAICLGDSIELYTSANLPIASYAWSPAPGLSSPDSSHTYVTPNQTTTYYVELDNGFCIRRDSVRVRVSNPIIDVVQDSITFCSSDSILLSATIVNPSTQLTFSWTPSPGINHPDSLSSMALIPSSGWYILTAVDSFGCPSLDSIYLNRVVQPQAQITSPDTVCGLQTTVQALASVSGSVLSWLPTTGISYSSTSSTNPTITAGQYGSYTLSLVETNGICQDTARFTIVFSEPITANAGTNFEVCGLTGLMDAVPSQAQGYWLPHGQVQFSDSLNPNSPVRTFNPGTYTLSWVNKRFACSDTDQVDVTFNPQPVADPGNSDSICGLTTTLNASLTGDFGLWTSLHPGISFLDSSQENTSVSASTYGTYTLVWTDSTLKCKDSDTIDLVFTEVPKPQVSDTTLCNTTVLMTGTQSIPSAQVEWSSNHPEISFSSLNQAQTQVNASTGGTYTIYFTETWYNCSTTDSALLRFDEMPLAFAGNDTLICGDSLLLTPSSMGDTTDGFWIPGPGLYMSDTAKAQSLAWVDTNRVTYAVWVAENGTCTHQDTIFMEFFERVNPDAGADFTVCGFTTDHSIQVTHETSALTWSGTGIQFSNLTDTSATLTVDSAGTFTLYITESLGVCLETDSVNITFIEQPIANAGGDRNTCGKTNSTQAQASVGTGIWTGDPNLVFSNPNQAVTQVTALNFGQYFAVWTETNGICSDSDTVYFGFYDDPTSEAGNPDTLCGLSAIVSGSGINGSFRWTGTGLNFFNPNQASTLATASAEGSYWAYLEVYNPGCSVVDSVLLTFYNTPMAQAGNDTFFCSLSGTTNADSTGYSGYWETLPGIQFTNPNQPITAVHADSQGVFQLVWHVENGPCTDSDTVIFSFYNSPSALTQDSLFVCGLSETITGAYTNGFPIWTGPTGIQFLSKQDSSTTQVLASNFGTYTLVFNVTNGPCLDRDTLILVFQESPNPAILGEDSICGKEGIFWSDNSGNGVWSSPSPGVQITSLGTDSILFSSSTYQSAWLYFKDSLENCTAQDSLYVHFLNTAQPVISGPSSLCQSNFQLQAAFSLPPDSFYWSSLNQVQWDSTLQNPLVTTLNSGLHTFILHAYVNGCAATDTHQVSVFQAPTANIDVQDSVCSNGFLLSISNLSPRDSLIWSSPDTGVSFTNPRRIQTLATSSGFGQIALILTVYNGPCSIQDTVWVEVKEGPNLSAGRDDTVCGMVYTLNGQTNTTIRWVLDPGLSISDTSDPQAFVTANSPGTYDLVMSGFKNGCYDEDTLSLVFYPEPSAMIQGQDSVCGHTTTLSAQNPNGGNLLWFSPNAGLVFQDSTGLNTGVSFPGNGSFTLYLQEQIGPCQHLDSLVVTVFDSVQTQITGPDTVCGFDVQLQVLTNGDSVKWTSVQGIPIPNSNQASISLNLPGSGLYGFVANGFNPNCSALDTHWVEVFDLPRISGNGQDSICGDSLGVQVSSAFAGYWHSPSPQISFTNPNSFSSLVQTSGYGTFELIFTQNQGPCTAADTLKVTFIETPMADAGNDLETCGDTVFIQAQPSLGTGVWSGANLSFDQATASGTWVYLSGQGQYQAIWTETNGNCVDSDTLTILRSAPPIISIQGQDSICGMNTNLSALSNGQGLHWLADPGLSLSGGGSQINLIANAPGTYWVYAHDSIGPCLTTDSFKLYFHSLPSAQAPADTIICGLEHFNGIPSVETGYWTTNHPDLIIDEDSLYNTLFNLGGEGVYEAYWNVYDGFCLNTDTFRITSNLPDYNEILSNADTLALGDGPFYFMPIDPNKVSYHWNFGDGDTSDRVAPDHTYSETGIYTVHLEILDENGCLFKTTKEVVVIHAIRIFVPNAFTPNGQGRNLNETFGPSVYGNLAEYQMEIYDRWGKRVFITYDPNERWNGTLFNAGEIMPQGSYVVVIKAQDLLGELFLHEGTVYLIR